MLYYVNQPLIACKREQFGGRAIWQGQSSNDGTKIPQKVNGT
jgi:hypothetical protein